MDIGSRVRGLAVGYCLGDALARAPEPGRGPLVAGTPSLLFLGSLEGLIRALVREDVTGHSGVAACLWHGTARWAWSTRQGDLPGVQAFRQAAAPHPWPDGWLAELSPLALGRGSAPAVEEALALEHVDPRPGHGPGDSAGDSVISRTLPVAALAAAAPWSAELGARVAMTARDVAGYSHGLAAQVIAVALTRSVARALAEAQVGGLSDLPDLARVYAGVPGVEEVTEARHALHRISRVDPSTPPLPATELAIEGVASGPRTALRAVAEGVRCAVTHPTRLEVAKALAEAAETGQPGAAAVTGALVGAAHGVRALPVDALARLDLAHVADQLASDLVTQLDTHPATRGGESTESWLHRYPAW